MIVPQKYRLKNTIKYPTTLIVGGINKLGLETASSLVEQGGYVIIVDSLTKENINTLDVFADNTMISFLDYTSIMHLEEDIRRLDYVFYFAHDLANLDDKISTQEFLTFSNYLDAVLSLSSKYDARFLLTTSIKAHEILYSEDDLMKGYDLSEHHTTYSEMEIQKYAEGLTLEYHQKAKLNTRIARLGEVIGEGMDFTKDTALVSLLFSAIKAEPLRLDNDGLDNEWYVHVLDCSYGLIKAMFTKNTEGQIFSVCYDNTYSQISVAYKIQELEENSREIQFVDNHNSLPPLKLHKPAPNLSKIGWLPRVSFDKAISQSLGSAKLFLLEQNTKVLNSHVLAQQNKGVVNKLKGFLSLAQTGDIPKSNPDDLNWQELVEKRKQVDNLRKHRITLASNDLTKRKRKRSKSIVEHVKDAFWGIYKAIASVFGVFKNKSPIEAGIMIFFMLFFIFIYFIIVAPAILFARDILIVIPESKKAQTYLENLEFDKFAKSSSKIESSLNSMKKIAPKFQGLAKFFTLDEEYNQTLTLINDYALYAEGANDMSKALSPLSSYMNSFENNTQVRSGTDSYLSISGAAGDYSQDLTEVKNNLPFFDAGMEKINQAIADIKNTNSNNLPKFLSAKIQSLNNTLINSQVLSKSESMQYLPEILGLTEAKTYLVVALDNTRPTPIGGAMSAYALLTVQKGGITESTVQSFDNANFNLNSVTADDLKLINNRRFNLKDKNTLDITDLSSIYSLEDYKDIMTRIVKDTYQRDVDGVFLVDLASIDQLTSALGGNYDFNVGGVKFGTSNFLDSLNSVQVANPSIQQKNDAISKIFAQVLNYSFSDISKNSGNVYKTLSESANKQDIAISVDIPGYSKYVEEQDYDSSSLTLSNSYVSVGINLTDTKAVNISRYSNVNLAMETDIDSSYNITNTLNIKYPSLGTTQEISVCLPLNVSSNTIKVTGIDASRIAINSNNFEKCIAATSLSETEINVSWTLQNQFTTNNGLLTLDLGIGKVKGLDTTLDYKIQGTDGIKLASKDTSNLNQNSIIFSKTMLSDSVFTVSISK